MFLAYGRSRDKVANRKALAPSGAIFKIFILRIP